jgi:hypothetical protein
MQQVLHTVVTALPIQKPYASFCTPAKPFHQKPRHKFKLNAIGVTTKCRYEGVADGAFLEKDTSLP